MFWVINKAYKRFTIWVCSITLDVDKQFLSDFFRTQPLARHFCFDHKLFIFEEKIHTRSATSV